VDLDIVLKAVEAASVSDAVDAADAALRAASAMPPEAPEFDRGIAAGLAISQYLRRISPIRAAA
jgi:hypothetical protein